MKINNFYIVACLSNAEYTYNMFLFYFLLFYHYSFLSNEINVIALVLNDWFTQFVMKQQQKKRDTIKIFGVIVLNECPYPFRHLSFMKH